MHICHITSGAIDVERILEKQCKGLGDEYSLSLVAEKSEIPDINPDGVTIYPYPAGLSLRERFEYLRQFAVNVQADIYQLHSPGLLSLVPFLRRQTKAALVYEMHLPYQDYITTFSDDMPSRRIAQSLLVGIWERGLLFSADGLLFSSRPLYKSRHASARFSMILYDFPRLDTLPNGKGNESGVFTIIYKGPITQPHGVLRLIEAFYYFYRTEQHGKLIITGPVDSPDLVPMLRETIKYLSLSHAITLKPDAPREETLSMLSSASVGIAQLLPSSFFRKTVPSSVFEYMAAGIPVIAGATPSAYQFVHDTKAGIVLEETTPESIAEALKFIYQHPVEHNLMGVRGKERVFDTWHWERMQSDLIDFYMQIYQWRKDQS